MTRPLATNTYDEYGRPGSGNLGRFQYTGQAYIASLGLYYNKARFYAPSLGKFLQPDPIGYAGGMNLYAYVGGDPVNFGDPSGKDRVCVTPTGSKIRRCAEVTSTTAASASGVMITRKERLYIESVYRESIIGNNRRLRISVATTESGILSVATTDGLGLPLNARWLGDIEYDLLTYIKVVTEHGISTSPTKGQYFAANLSMERQLYIAQQTLNYGMVVGPGNSRHSAVFMHDFGHLIGYTGTVFPPGEPGWVPSQLTSINALVLRVNLGNVGDIAGWVVTQFPVPASYASR